MFLGEHERNVDDKGRLAMPAEFRGFFGQGLVVTRGFDRCIAAYPLEAWMQLAQRLASLPLTRSANRRLNRAAFASAFRLEPDRQGRILLPLPLRKWADINDAVVVVGMLNYVEIWSRDRWLEERAHLDDRLWHLAEEVDPSSMGH